MSHRPVPEVFTRPSRRLRGHVLFILAIAWLCVLAGGQAASAQAISQAQLGALGHPDYEAREHATQKLLRDERLSSRDVISSFGRARTEEQRERLLSIAWHHLMREQLEAMANGGAQAASRDGAIGIKLDAVPARQLANNRQAAILVVSTSPGFPGYAYLRAHDLIISVNGETVPPLQSQREVKERFVARIKQLGAGTRVDMTINRNGEIIEESFELSDHSQLQRLYGAYNPNEISPRHAEAWMRLNQAMREELPDQAPLTFSLPEARKNRHNAEAAEAELAGLESVRRRERVVEQMAQLQRDLKVGRITAEQYAQRLYQLRVSLERDEARNPNINVRVQTFVRPVQPVDLREEAVRQVEQDLDPQKQ